MRQKEKNDLGFGTKSHRDYNRFLNKDGSVNVERKSGAGLRNIDFYHYLITMPLLRFTVLVIVSYFIINLLFAIVYFTIGTESFGNLNPENNRDKFWELFFFSAQTLTTVGYGYIYPKSHYASSVAAFESMIGLLGFAIATGLLYGRFSRPRAAIIYSSNMVVAPYRGITALMFRIANSKQNELIEAEAQIVVSMKNLKTGGRIFQQLPLELSRINFLALNWTIVHPIDEESPLHGVTEKELMEADAEFLILIKAYNDTYAQTVYSRISYKADEVLWGHKFTSWNTQPGKKGRIRLDLDEINRYEKTPSAVKENV